MKSDDKHIIIFIFVFALILRICFLVVIKDQFLYTLMPDSDCKYYHVWATEISKGGFLGKSIFYGMPLYPYFLGIIYKIFGPSPIYGHIFQFILGAFNAVLIYLIAKRIFNQKVAVLSSLIFASYAMIIFYEVLLMPVALILFLNSILIMLALRVKERPSKGRIYLLGLTLGITALAEAGILIFLVIIIIWFLFGFKQNLREKIIHILILIFSVFLILSLVVIRNYIVGKDFVLITAHSGINFFLGNNPQATGRLSLPPYLRSTQKGLLEDARIYAERQVNKRLRPSEISSFWTRKALDFIKKQPLDYVKLLLKKIRIFWHNFEPVDTMEFSFLYDKKIVFNILTHSFGIIASLSLIGLVVAFLRYGFRQQELLLFFIISQNIASILFFVTARNRLVVVPFLIMFTSYLLYWVYMQIKKKRFKSFLFMVPSFVLIFIVINFKNPGYNYLIFEKAYNLGILYTIQRAYNEAKKQFNKAIDFKPEDYMSYFGLANVYYLEGDYRESLKLYLKTLKINPNFIDAYFNLGRLFQAKGDFEKSEKFYKIVINLDSRALDAYFNLANIYKSQGKCDKAIRYYQKIIRDNPQYYNQVYPKLKECLK
jgi:tetratricopeptide (TPR) repeat protein